MQLEEEVDEDDELVAEQEDEEPMAIDGYPMTIAIGQPEGGKLLKFQCLAAHELIIDSIRMVCVCMPIRAGTVAL